MKKLLSISHSETALTIGLLLLRLIYGVTMMSSGYNKLVHFAEIKGKFMSFLGLGSTASLSLVVFAEFFCAMFVILGLFTRLSVIPLIICMSVALFKAHGGDFMGDGMGATHYLCIFLFLLMVGPGKASVDGIAGK